MAEPGRPGTRRRARGVLLVYHRPTRRQFVDASNVDENIASFQRHSRFQVWGLNTDLGTPPRLGEIEFDAVVIHYSVFLPLASGYLLGDELLEWLDRSSAYKIATFQDEHHYCGKRFDFLDEHGIDCVFTMLEPPHAERVYGANTNVSRVVPNLPAYVGSELLETAQRFAQPLGRRPIDVGYRGRPMPAYMGAGAQEKREIGERFLEAAADSGLRLDIGVAEGDRLYGDDWNRFIAGSRGTLGVESGVSCFDLRDEVREQWERLSADGHEPTVAEMQPGALGRWDWKIPYRTISPRNLEAAAFRVCQILYEGSYSGLLEPMRHYIPLRKDLSNFDEVIERFEDESLCRELIANAYDELIASGELGYEVLIRSFDEVLTDAGLSPRAPTRKQRRAVDKDLAISRRERAANAAGLVASAFARRFPRLWERVYAATRAVRRSGP